MTQLLHFFTFLNILSWTRSQVVLTQSGSEMKKPGESTRLTCSGSGFNVGGSSMHWIRQPPGKGLEWIVYYYSPTDNNYSPSIQGRFSASKSGSKFYLQMNNLKSEDTAVYYCARGQYSGALFDYWGPGTTVTVTSETARAPSVFPLSPANKDVGTSSDISIGCFIKDYFPHPVSVQWNAGGITSGIRMFPEIQSSSSSLFKVTNQLTIPVSSWKSGTYQCNVQHESTGSSITTTVKPREEAKPTAPTVRILHTSCNPDATDSRIELVCQVSGFVPSDIDVKWLGSSGPISAETEQPRQNASDGTYSTTSTISVPQSEWLEGSPFTCEVFHPGSQSKVKSKAKMCAGATSDIKVFGVGPSPMDLYVERDPKIGCVVYNLDSESELQVTWSRLNGRPVTPELLKFKDEDNGTVTATSSVVISDREWLSGEKFICTVTHPSLPVAKQVNIKKQTGPTSPPSVYLFRPHHEELQSNGQYVSITALVKGFKPNDISSSWLKEDNPLPSDNFVNTPVISDGNGSYFFYSKLNVLKSDWNRGDSYTFMVVHEALRMKFIQKSIAKTQAKK